MVVIVYIVSTLKCTGPVNQLFNIIKYLDRDVFEPHIVALSLEPKESRWDDFEMLNVNMHSLGLSRIKGLFFNKVYFSRLLNEIRPNFIHSQGIRPDTLSSKIAWRVPSVCTIRNFPQLDYVMTYGKLRGKLMANIHVAAMKKIDRCVGVSTAVCENLEYRYGVKNVSCIRNGVDTEYYYPVDEFKKKELRSQLQIPLDKKVWISSGHLSSRKDPLAVANAFNKAFSSDENVLLYIGGGELENKCREELAQYKNIIFCGRVKNVAPYLQASDYFVSASKAEGMPNAVLEALACGAPVLLSDIGPHKEIIDIEPECGLLYTLGSQEELVAAYKKMLALSYVNISNAATNLIDMQLSAVNMSKNYQKVYLA